MPLFGPYLLGTECLILSHPSSVTTFRVDPQQGSRLSCQSKILAARLDRTDKGATYAPDANGHARKAAMCLNTPTPGSKSTSILIRLYLDSK